MFVDGSTTTHHNIGSGVRAYFGAVVDLMGEQTSVHDNEGYGLSAWYHGSTINVYQPCVLNDINKGQNIFEVQLYSGGGV